MNASKWIIVSNRLPVKVDGATGKLAPSSGGLVSAIMGIKGCPDLVWTGALSGSINNAELREFCSLKSESVFTPLPVIIEDELYRNYYSGFCNSVLWPLLHYESERVDFSYSEWEAYRKVNQQFADVVCSALKGDEIVWVHDFHLFLLPALIKKRNPNVKVGFFLHTPFPSSEIYRQVPVRRELLEGVLPSDLIGFHDFSYLRHFASSVGQVLGIDSNLLTINQGASTAELGVFPVSIDTEKFISTSASEEVDGLFDQHLTSGDKCRLVLGVDRLDYIKGIKLKLKAFSRFLEKYPEMIGKISLVQLAVPSRTDVPEYLQLKQDVEQLVGEINGEFGTPHYAPVKYIFGELSFAELVALYRYSEVLLVSSKRDGMNLVCLEYLAAQDPDSPGVIVLSEFAGASSTLAHAYTINPWDAEQIAEVLHEALQSDKTSRVAKHKEMVDYLRGYTATDWAESFVSALTSHPERYSSGLTKLINPEEYSAALKPVVSKDRLVLFLDFDGTLAAIEELPSDVYLTEATSTMLAALSSLRATDVIVVSGRDEEFLTSRLDESLVGIASEHGASYRDRSSSETVSLFRADRFQWQETAKKVMGNYCRRVPGSFVENKKFGVAWHFRKSPSEFGEYQSRRLRIDLEGTLRGQPAFVMRGSKVVEVRAAEANKGSFLEWYLDNYSFSGEPIGVVCIGDDVTDEDMFSAVNKTGGVSIKVGRADTCAEYCVDSQEDVIGVLQTILELRK